MVRIQIRITEEQAAALKQYAILDADDLQHEVARNTWANLLESGDGVICNSCDR